MTLNDGDECSSLPWRLAAPFNLITAHDDVPQKNNRKCIKLQTLHLRDFITCFTVHKNIKRLALKRTEDFVSGVALTTIRHSMDPSGME